MFTPALGWQRDTPDFRDYSLGTPKVHRLLSLAPRAIPKLPDKIDLRDAFGEVDDQRQLNASPAHACAGLWEYFERRALGRMSGLSRLFLHQNTQLLQGTDGRSAMGLRATFRAMTRFGVPPERLWPYEPELDGVALPPHLYAFRDRFRSLVYVRLDGLNATGVQTLQMVRAFLSAGFATAFGFVVPDSLSREAAIPYRPTFDAVYGGQAAIAVGYDDRWIGSTRGALLIRNSWGQSWGEEGYGWLPYAYVEQQLAVDFWTVMKKEWLKTGEFSRPRWG